MCACTLPTAAPSQGQWHPRGGAPGREACLVGLKGLPPHVTALPHATLDYENNVGMEVSLQHKRDGKKQPSSHGLDTTPPAWRAPLPTAATPETPGTAEGPDADSSWCHMFCSSFVVLPILKSHAGLLSRSQSMTKKTQIKHGHTSQTPPAHQPWEPSCRRGRGHQGDRAGKLWTDPCRDVACFSYY